MDHIIEFRDFEIGIGGDREGERDALRLVHIFDPCEVFLDRIGRQAQRLAVALIELGGEARGHAHFSDADRGEIGRVAEEEHPSVTCPFVQADRSGGCVHSEIGGGIADMQAHDVCSLGWRNRSNKPDVPRINHLLGL